jgi:hypothetical protein
MMKLPNLEKAYVPQEKITEYLLSEEHDEGKDKAGFFTRFGFSVAQWEIMAEALLKHAYTHEVKKVQTNKFGARYVVEGKLETPDERNPQVRSVWFIPIGEDAPRLTTAYPLKE